MQDLTARLDRLHKRIGSPTYSLISKELYRDYGYDVHEESIRKAHTNQVDPSQCNVELLLALAAYYGVADKALGKVAALRMHTARTLVLAGPDMPPTQDRLRLSWTARRAAQTTPTHRGLAKVA